MAPEFIQFKLFLHRDLLLKAKRVEGCKNFYELEFIMPNPAPNSAIALDKDTRVSIEELTLLQEYCYQWFRSTTFDEDELTEIEIFN